jgi:hypothetical protein
VGKFLTFFKQQGLLLFPVNNDGSMSVPLALQVNQNLNFLEFFPLLQGFHFELSVFLGESLKKSPVSSAL